MGVVLRGVGVGGHKIEMERISGRLRGLNKLSVAILSREPGWGVVWRERMRQVENNAESIKRGMLARE